MTEEQTPAVSVRGLGASVVTYRFGGREYPMKTVPRCHVCMSPYRFEIEEAIVAGLTYRRINEQIDGYYAEDDEIKGPSTRSMADHFKGGHMPLELGSTREIVESRARRVGKAIETGQEQLVDGITLMETVVMKAFERIARGESEVGVVDGLRAAKMLSDLGEYDGSSVDQQAYVDAFMVYQEEAQRIMGEEAFDKFGEALSVNPVLKALAARYDGEDLGEDIVDADIVEEPSGGNA